VRTRSMLPSRLVLCSLSIAALSAGSVGAPESADAISSREPSSAPPANFEAQIEELVRSWFAVLEDPNAEPETLSGLLAEPPFELLLDGAALRDRGSLAAWVSRLRATYPQIDYRIDPIRIYDDGRDRYRVRFEFDRRALDAAGLSHVARREHTWIVQGNAEETPTILRMEERPLLFYPGTGPEIVCY
jgi:hypothetical protein